MASNGDLRELSQRSAHIVPLLRRSTLPREARGPQQYLQIRLAWLWRRPRGMNSSSHSDAWWTSDSMNFGQSYAVTLNRRLRESYIATIHLGLTIKARCQPLWKTPVSVLDVSVRQWTTTCCAHGRQEAMQPKVERRESTPPESIDLLREVQQ